MEEIVRAKISARSFAWAFDIETDSGVVDLVGMGIMDDARSILERSIDTVDGNACLEKSWVSIMSLGGGVGGRWSGEGGFVIGDRSGGPADIGEAGVGAEAGFQTGLFETVESLDVRLGMSMGASREALAPALTLTELRGDMAESR